MSDRRLIDIETKLAFQEDTLHALNLVICKQQEQIDQLEQTCRLLYTRLEELIHRRDVLPTTPDSDKPPHY